MHLGPWTSLKILGESRDDSFKPTSHGTENHFPIPKPWVYPFSQGAGKHNHPSTSAEARWCWPTPRCVPFYMLKLLHQCWSLTCTWAKSVGGCERLVRYRHRDEGSNIAKWEKCWKLDVLRMYLFYWKWGLSNAMLVYTRLMYGYFCLWWRPKSLGFLSHLLANIPQPGGPSFFTAMLPGNRASLRMHFGCIHDVVFFSKVLGSELPEDISSSSVQHRKMKQISFLQTCGLDSTVHKLRYHFYLYAIYSIQIDLASFTQPVGQPWAPWVTGLQLCVRVTSKGARGSNFEWSLMFI